MKRPVFWLLFPLLLVLAGVTTAQAAPPEILDVKIDRGHDTDAPDWTYYHQRVIVWATDPDGAGNIESITITDSASVDHVKTPGCGCWWQEDDFTIRCEWSEWHLLEPPADGTYSVTVMDEQTNSDALTSPFVALVSAVHPEVVAPVNDTVIYDPAPTFEWTEGIPGSSNTLHLLEEGTWPEIWVVDLGTGTAAPYDFDEMAAISALQPNHSYFWMVESWYPDDDHVTDPKVGIWTAQHTRGRFTLYGDWPATPPDLPGKLAHSMVTSGWEVGYVSNIQYNTDPHARLWLGPDYMEHPDWSPDGSALLYALWGAAAWIDPLDGSPPVQIPGAYGGDFRWAPDGQRVVYTLPSPPNEYTSPWPNDDVWITDTAGTSAYPVVDSPEYLERWPDWSPDGEWLCYGRNPGPDWLWYWQWLWLVRPDGSDNHPVVVTGVVGYPGYEVTWMGWETGWSPDGKKLVTIFEAAPPEGPTIRGVGVIPREGGPVTPVFLDPPGVICCAGSHLPQWSPDGTQIVFTSGHHLPSEELPAWQEFSNGPELWLMNADGSGDPVRLTYNHSFDYYVSWWALNTETGLGVPVNIDDITVIFDEVIAEGSTSIYVTDPPAPAPGGLTILDYHTYQITTTADISGDVTVVADYSDHAYPPVLGERLSLLLWNGAAWVDITVPPVDTENCTVTGCFTPGLEREWTVSLSLDKPAVPDVKVMFEACTYGRPVGPGLFVADADLSDPVRVTLPTPGPALLPECVCLCGTAASVWSPDGSQVAMHGPDANLYLLDLTTLIQTPGQLPQVLTDEWGDPIQGGMPGWSPSGDKLVYTNVAEVGPPTLCDSINVVSGDGTGKQALYTFPEPTSDAIRWLNWSPDGERVVFEMASWVHYEAHVYLLEDLTNPSGATLRQLTTDDAYNEDTPHWSPDGKHVVFTRSARDSAWWDEPGAEIWISNVITGVENQITSAPGIARLATGWCPYDGYIYYQCYPAAVPGAPTSIHRILPDGTGDEIVRPDTFPAWGTLERWSWIPTGVWIDGLNALPGESVTPEIGMADAEKLAGVQAKVRYTGGANTLTLDSILQGGSILDWAMPTPVIGPDVASFLAFAPNPGTQNISGVAHLFDLNVTNSPAAQPGDLQLLTFDDLRLSDDWGDPISRIFFNGGVRTIPFAYLEVSAITGPVCADPDYPVPVPVTITALDRGGWTMPDCNATVDLQAFTWSHWKELGTVTPPSVTLVNGVWSGEVMIAEPDPSWQLLAHWEDIGGYSNAFQAIAKADTNGDFVTDVFDIVKVANMAVERGEWADWQLWAGDVNGDGVVDILDVTLAVEEAMGAMEMMAMAPAASAEPVHVTVSTTSTKTQTTLSVELSDCANLAGIQVEIAYDAKRLSYRGLAAGELLSGYTSWSLLDNDLGGSVKAIAYTPIRQTLAGGAGGILTFTFDQVGSGKGKVELTSVKLSAPAGVEIPCQTGKGKGKGKDKDK